MSIIETLMNRRKEEDDDAADDDFDDDEGDMENSGMHTNDRFNSFDSQGRVLVRDVMTRKN